MGMDENRKSILGDDEKMSGLLQELASTSNPFKLFMQLSFIAKRISDEIEELSEEIVRNVVDRRANSKRAILYDLTDGKDMEEELASTEKILTIDAWSRKSLLK